MNIAAEVCPYMPILTRVLLSLMRRLGVDRVLREQWRDDVTHAVASVRQELRADLKAARQEHGEQLRGLASTQATRFDEAGGQLREVEGIARRLANEVQAAAAKDRERRKALVRRVDDIDARSLSTAEGLAALMRSVDELRDVQNSHARKLRLLEKSILLTREQKPLVARFEAMRASGEIEAHVRRAVASAPMHHEPTRYMVVRNLLPPAFYEIVLAALPPEEAFSHRDPVKQNFKPGQYRAMVPELSAMVWEYLDGDLVPTVLGPALAARFGDAIEAYYERLFGPEGARRLIAAGPETSGGRLMLRRPGYYIGPHLDVARAALTTLVYLARPGDDPSFGTQLFRVNGATLGAHRSTYYPGNDGTTCELAATVPFEANSAFSFHNADAAHGAEIPVDAPPSTERYSYQFYLGPPQDALRAIVSTLSPEEQLTWSKD